MAKPVSAAARRADFIRQNTRLMSPPLVPEISLWLADEATALWASTEEEMGKIGLPPPFWAFPWAGGQALARYILDHPETVRGKRVLDIGSGSGLIAIAAAMAGAARVEATEIDDFAFAAIALNAAQNGVEIVALADNPMGRDDGWDIALAGDISYERDMTAGLTGWLVVLARRGALTLIGDPGRNYFASETLTRLAAYDVPVSRDIEDSDIKRSGVWRFGPGSPP